MAFFHAEAQPLGARNIIRYLNRHVLCQQADAINVLDLDLEWPEVLENASSDSLQHHLQAILFHRISSNWIYSVKSFISDFGTPITNPLEKIPDDDKFAYVSCKLHELGFWEGRFISFVFEVSCMPGKGSVLRKYHKRGIVTYDMIRREFLTRGQILRMNKVLDEKYFRQFSQLLLTCVETPLGKRPASIKLAESIGIGKHHLIIPYVAFGGELYESKAMAAYVPIEKCTDFLGRDFRKRLQTNVKEEKVGDKMIFSLDQNLNVVSADSCVYDTVQISRVSS